MSRSDPPRLDCNLLPLADRPGWGVCPECDPHARKPLPLAARRNCRGTQTTAEEYQRRVRRAWFAAVLTDRWRLGHRDTDTIGMIIDACASANHWPCLRETGKLDQWIADVLDPDAWREEWGDAGRPIRVRHLLYHVYPSRASEVWLQNLVQIRRRLGLFNGRVLFAVVTGDGLHPPSVVRAALDWPTAEIIAVPNDPHLGEAATFPRMLERVYTKSADEAIFYAHTKGAGYAADHPQAEAIELWRNAMYHVLLDDWSSVAASLGTNDFCGAYRVVHGLEHRWPSGLVHGQAHYSGTFFWFSSRVFRDPHWRCVPADKYGVEAWPGGMATPDKLATLHQPWPADVQYRSGYDLRTHTIRIHDEPPPPVPEPAPRTSVVITCKGRLSYLRRTLPTWLAQTEPCEVIVVDYGCPDHTADWLAEHFPQVRTVRVERDTTRFNQARARNCGGVAARGERLVFADADLFVGPDFVAVVNERMDRERLGILVIAHPHEDGPGRGGNCVVDAAWYHRARGYDEDFRGYGLEDTDLYERLRRLGIKEADYCNALCEANTPTERTLFYGGGPIEESIERNRIRLHQHGRAVNTAGYGLT